MNRLQVFVAGFVCGVLTPIIVFLSVAVFFPGERSEFILTSDLVVDDVVVEEGLSEQPGNDFAPKSIIRGGRSVFVNARNGRMNYISFEMAVTDETLATHAKPLGDRQQESP